MLTFKELKFRNVRSYGKNITTISFTKSGTTLIIGKSDDDSTTNGIGKTSLLTCLTWLTFDKVIDAVNKDELINNVNKVDMWGEVSFDIQDCSVVIQRWRKGGKSNRENGVALFVNGEDVTPSSIDETNKKIQTLIGIDFELFSRIVVFSASNKSFFDMPTTSANDANQTNMIEQLFGLQTLSEKAATLKGGMRETDAELKVQKRLLEQATQQLSAHETSIQSTELKAAAWETRKSTSITTLQASLSETTTLDNAQFAAERKLHNKLATYQKARSELAGEIKSTNATVKQVERRLADLSKEAVVLEAAKCPYCSQDYAEAKHKLHEVKDAIDKATSQYEELLREVEQTAQDFDEIDELIKATTDSLTVPDFQRLVELRENHSELVAKLEQLKESTNPHLETLQELMNMQPTPPDYNTINTLTHLNEHQQFLLKLLTKKDSFVRKALLHKNLPLLNTQLSIYITELGLPHKVEFTPNLTATISQFGRELSFGCLSAGQKARVNFALSLAFCDVMQALHQKVNIQLFDEVLDIGLDRHGIVAASKLLKRKAMDEDLSIFIISHREEVQNLFDHTLTVRRIDGFSQITHS